MRTNYYRRPRGLSALLLLLLIPASMLLGVVAVDVAHYENTRSALLKAADAAALSGEHDIMGYNVQNGFSAAGLAKITKSARDVAQMNLADGEWITHSPPSVTVTVDPSETTDLIANKIGYTDVIITKTNLKLLLGPLIGRSNETLVVHSRAGVTGFLATSVVFPMSVSWNKPNSDGIALNAVPPNGKFWIEITNAANAWALASGSQVRKYAKVALGMTGTGKPLVKSVGQPAGSSSSSSIGPNVINNSTYQGPMSTQEVILPVVDDSDVVMGFIGFRADPYQGVGLPGFPGSGGGDIRVYGTVRRVANNGVSGGAVSPLGDLSAVTIKLRDVTEPDSTYPTP